MGRELPPPTKKEKKNQLHLNTSDFGEMWTIQLDLHEKHNESNLNFLGGHVGRLWGAAPLKIEFPKGNSLQMVNEKQINYNHRPQDGYLLVIIIITSRFAKRKWSEKAPCHYAPKAPSPKQDIFQFLIFLLQHKQRNQSVEITM